MKRIFAAAALSACIVSGMASAAPVNTRQLNQERRIETGKRTGTLTESEYHRLQAQQESIRAQVKQMRMRHPHGLTQADKRRLTALQNRADAAINAQKHDAQRGPNKLKL